MKRTNPIPIILVALVAFVCANFMTRWAVRLSQFSDTVEAAESQALE